VIRQLEPLAGDFNGRALVVGPEPADVIKAAGEHLVVEIEAATNHFVWHQHQVVVINDLPVAMTLYAELQVSSGIRAAAGPATELEEKRTASIGVIVLRKPVVVPKSARSIPPQVTNEKHGPDDEVSSYCPQSGPYGLRHSAIPQQRQKGGDYRPDGCRAATQSNLPSEGSTCTPGGASDLSNPKPFPSMSLLAPTSTHRPGILPPGPAGVGNTQKRSGKPPK
jgi:hypothetical protein